MTPMSKCRTLYFPHIIFHFPIQDTFPIRHIHPSYSKPDLANGGHFGSELSVNRTNQLLCLFTVGMLKDVEDELQRKVKVR